MSEFDNAAFIRFLGTFADRIRERRDELTRLDSAIGDADHGINMDRGFSAVQGKLGELEALDLGATAKAVGMTLISTVGGASGPLYGTFFLRLASAFGDARAVDANGLGSALRAGLEGVVQRGKATLDDKTMVDAMSSAVDAYEATAAGNGVSAGLEAAATAAAEGRDRITPMVARKGRASYLGERSANHQDPGATSTTILFESLRDAVAAG
jgi:dihydroxyacetone kinase-like protein